MKAVIMLLAFILPMPSFACSCLMTDFSDAGSENNIDISSFIFEGKVLSVTPIIVEEGAFEDNGITRAPHENNYFSEIKVEIKQLYKGLRDVEILTAYIDVGTTCGTSPYLVKERHFFVIYKYKGDYVVAGHCEEYISDKDLIILKRGDYLASD